jgi:hypothetical protein
MDGESLLDCWFVVVQEQQLENAKRRLERAKTQLEKRRRVPQL